MSPVPDLFSITFGRSGPLVVFCHGLLGQGRNFAMVAKHLGLNGARTVLLDMPNHGRSLWTEHFDYRETADIVARWLTASPEVGGEPAVLVGHSMGGKIAMLIALEHPELVDRLVVADMSPVTYRRNHAFRDIVDAIKHLDLANLKDREQASEVLRQYLPDHAIRAWVLQNLARDGRSWRWLPNLDLLDAELDRVLGWPEGVEGSWPGPTLWIKGADSDYVLPEYTPVMKSYFPATLKVTIKDAGHWVHTEQREVFTSTVERFVLPAPAPAAAR
ncbi:Pimeloyl-ACP methyl ester carboxylesterase [Raineyella antarctica]|uniref:Pimeloyl-ACP methyl ester carboxylesterase n=1 Tax=Raineyella antarctica TaxID=1577474 RepID=A0A1G6GUD7_9ACTN|nr:alpha/beta fold hydrolase [Raineyella antarctica]SDB85541.1 Pimeloyl-ACP methyl ester carboxylesterase [Raineyella antarctica]